MLSLARNGYAAAAVDKAFHAGGRTIGFRYEVYDANGSLKIGVTPTVLDGSVTWDASQDIHRTATFTILDTTAINFLSDRIKPYVRILMLDGGWAEFPLGVFLLSTPPRHDDGTVITRQIQAYDLCQQLTDAKTVGRYTAGSSFQLYTDAINAALAAAGIGSTNITASLLQIPTAMDWPPGTTYLKIVNDLLLAINYRPMYFDADGIAQGTPYLTSDQRPVNYTYTDDWESVIFPGVDDAFDLFGVPNEWVAVVSQPDRSVLTSIYTNTNSASPTSTVSRGRTIVSFDSSQTASDQATLDAIVLRQAFTASQVYHSATFSTAIMPMHGDNDVLQIVNARLGINAKYEEMSWSIPLKAGGQMSHTARRVVSI